MKSKHSGMLRSWSLVSYQTPTTMKSKHSGMLSFLFLSYGAGLIRWNLNTVECWVSLCVSFHRIALWMKSKHSGMLRNIFTTTIIVFAKMKSKHSGMLRLYFICRQLQNITRWNLNTVECWVLIVNGKSHIAFDEI